MFRWAKSKLLCFLRETYFYCHVPKARHNKGFPGTLKIKGCKSGDYTAVVPPVPIPNTEVKYRKADDSDLFRESR